MTFEPFATAKGLGGRVTQATARASGGGMDGPLPLANGQRNTLPPQALVVGYDILPPDGLAVGPAGLDFYKF